MYKIDSVTLLIIDVLNMFSCVKIQLLPQDADIYVIIIKTRQNTFVKYLHYRHNFLVNKKIRQLYSLA